MGFDLGRWLEETGADINPFDNGRTGATVRAQRQKPAPARTVSNQNKQRPTFQVNQQGGLTPNNPGLSIKPLTIDTPKMPTLRPQQPAQPKQPQSNPLNEVGKFVDKNIVKPIVNDANKVYNTVQAPVTGLTGAAAIGADKLFNGGKNERALTQATAQQMNQNINRSFVKPQVATGKASPIEFAKNFTSTGADLGSKYAPVGAGVSLAKTPLRQAIKPLLKEGAAYTVASTGADVLNNRPVTPQSVAMNAAGSFGGAFGGAALTRGAKNTVRAQREATLKAATDTQQPIRAKTSVLNSYEGAPDRTQVDFYKQQIQQNKPVDPIITMKDQTGRYGIEDGKHRFQAYKELGFNEVPIKVATPERVQAVAQGGYAKMPFLEPNERPIPKSAQEYAHSSSPEDILKETVNSSHNYDKQAKGGKIINRGEYSDPYTADGGMVRTSDHTPFYSRHFKETGRKPSKAAYQQEIQRQLDAGGGDLVQKDIADAYQLARTRQAENDAVISSASPTEGQYLPRPQQPAQPIKPKNSRSPQQLQPLDSAPQSPVRSTLDSNVPQDARIAPLENPSQIQLQRRSQTADTPDNPYPNTTLDESTMQRIHAMNPDVPVGVQPRGVSRTVGEPFARPSSYGNKPTSLQEALAGLKSNTLPRPANQVNQTAQLFPSYPNNTPIKITTRAGEKNIPVRQMSREGDVVTGTNINPNIKAKEKRFSVDDSGELIEDRKGAYRIFTDEDGRVNGFRVGNQYFDSKQLGDLSDVNDYGSSLATMRRNVERGFGKETSDKVGRFLVDHQQGQATKLIERQLTMKQGMKQVADDLGISFGIGRGKAKKVSAAIQDFGEGNKNKSQLVDEFGADMAEKIVKADKWFRQQYDTLLDEANTVLKQYGYDPIPKRKNYYTHFQEPSLWQSFGLKMQEIKNIGSPTMQDALPDSARGKISNKLAGESEFTQPNKRFNPFALKREGDLHTSDAFTAFERYLNPTLNNIYMTPSITRARVLAKAVAQDADVMGKDANKIIIQTKEWANRLAGKSARADRPLVDSNWGQKYLKASRWAQTKAGQNTIVGNLSTAVMQPIVLGQTTGKFGIKNTILGALQTLDSVVSKNNPIDQSSFLKRRYTDLTPVTASKMDKARNVANTPLQVVEETSARITWNAAHNDALSKGLKGKEAIRYADIQAEKTLAGRSIGEKPEAFETKGIAPFTMYQLEVNNFWQQFAKEMTPAQAAKTMAAMYGLNLALQATTGRQVGFNPIDAVIDSYDLSQEKDRSTGEKTKAIAQRLGGEVVDNLPFAGQVATTLIGDDKYKEILGKDSQGGRFGVKSPLATLVDNPWYAVSPFGGSQIKKTIEGFNATKEGKLTDKKGRTTVNIPTNLENYLKGTAFGKSAIPEVGAYYDNLGRKKSEQKVVPNQTDSRASKMGKPTVKSEPYSEKTYKERYQTTLDKYNKNKKSMSEVERFATEGRLAKLKVQKDYSNDTISLYGMSKAKAYSYLTTHKDGEKLGQQLMAYDNALFNAGLTKYRKYGNGLAPATKKGGRKTGRKGGGRKGSKGSSKGKFSYKLNGFGQANNSKQLRSLLKKAKMKQTKVSVKKTKVPKVKDKIS